MSFIAYQQKKWLLLLLTSMTLISCVTINIYFPAAAAEKAAEKIVDEVLGPNQAAPENQAPKEGAFNITVPTKQPVLLSVLDFFIPAAHAEANISIDSPEIRAIRNSLSNRQNQLKPFFDAGNAGFTNNGLVDVINTNGLSVKSASTLKKLISADNADRHQLYKAIAKENGHPEWQSDIQATFAKTWINKIPSGWMYQTSGGSWVKK